MDINIKANGGVLPAGTLKTKPLEGEEHDLEIVGLELFHDAEQAALEKREPKVPVEWPVLRLKYPDGEVHSHQMKNTEEDLPALIDKITRKMRGKFGVDNIEFDKLPELKVGAKIKLKKVK